MARLTLEIIATSVEDAIEAARGGAHRLEVVRDLARGGLTPSIELVRAIQAEVRLPLRVILRESDGFDCRPEARQALVEAAAAYDELGVDGIVVGWIRRARVDEETLGRVLDAAPSLRATFHRAFDAVPEPEAALRTLRKYAQIDHVLTNAGAATSRCAILASYTQWAGPGITMLPGGDIDEAAVRTLNACDCVGAVHVGRAARIGRTVDGPVSAAQVAELRRAAGWV
jgi:copper homeostasis protein